MSLNRPLLRPLLQKRHDSSRLGSYRCQRSGRTAPCLSRSRTFKDPLDFSDFAAFAALFVRDPKPTRAMCVSVSVSGPAPGDTEEAVKSGGSENWISLLDFEARSGRSLISSPIPRILAFSPVWSRPTSSPAPSLPLRRESRTRPERIPGQSLSRRPVLQRVPQRKTAGPEEAGVGVLRCIGRHRKAETVVLDSTPVATRAMGRSKREPGKVRAWRPHDGPCQGLLTCRPALLLARFRL
jgi:hypothetical protein